MPQKLPPGSLLDAYEFARTNGCEPQMRAIKANRDLTSRQRREAAHALFLEMGILTRFLEGGGYRTMSGNGRALESRSFQRVSAAGADTVIHALGGLAAIHSSLQQTGAVRSQRIVGDLGEWIASQVLGLNICTSRVQAGWDLEGDGMRVQVKTHAKGSTNHGRRTSLRSDALRFDALVIVVLSDAYLLRSLIGIPQPVIASVRCNANDRRMIQWGGMSEFAFRGIPAVLRRLLSPDSELLADDAAHRDSVADFRARVKPEAAG